MNLLKRLVRAHAPRPAAGPSNSVVEPDISKDDTQGAISFGYKSAWVAIESTQTDHVVAALDIEDAREQSWIAAFDSIERKPDLVVVTPPIGHWTLIALNGERAQEGRPMVDLATLSRRFGQVQQFATHRVVEYHEWQRWVDGALIRRYAYIGERGAVLADEGEADAAEGGVVSRAELDSLADSDDQERWDALRFADEDTVMTVAAAWSVDPTTLGERSDITGRPILGRLRR